jgi:hypothetical protein
MPAHHITARSRRCTRQLASFAAAAGIAVALTTSAALAQPSAGHRRASAQVQRCYQLNPIVPGQPRGYHRVRC